MVYLYMLAAFCTLQFTISSKYDFFSPIETCCSIILSVVWGVYIVQGPLFSMTCSDQSPSTMEPIQMAVEACHPAM